MIPPRYAQRVARIPRVMDILSRHPDGLPLTTVAAELRVSPETLREDLLVFYGLDLPDVGLSTDSIEFVGHDADSADPGVAPVVRISSSRPLSETGVEYLSADRLATLSDAAREILSLEPANADLAGALRVLEESLLPGLGSPGPGVDRGPEAVCAALRDGMSDRRTVAITYTRYWQPGISVRTIEPYALVRTKRGWEVDAGRADDGSPPEHRHLRTYLLSGITTAELLDQRFQPPADVEQRLEAHRRLAPVEVVVHRPRLWAVERFAERVEVLAVDDGVDACVKARAWLLPPLERRLGLMLLVAGEDAFVVTPLELDAAARDMAADLLDHHFGPG